MGTNLLIRKPAEIQAKKTIAALIYGQPGMGKTTLACTAPSPVLFDFDGGVTRIREEHQVPTVQVDSWETAITALGQVSAMPEFKTIIVDTLSKMIDCIVTSICGTRPPKIQEWGLVNAKFKDFLRSVAALNLNVVFVAQRTVEKDGDVNRYVPDVRQSNYKDVVCDMDVIGYMEMATVKGMNVRRITFDPTPRNEGKNTAQFDTYYDLPTLLPGQRSTFLADRIGEYLERQAKRMASNKAAAEQAQAVVAEFESRMAKVDDAMSLNDLCAWVRDQQAVGDVKVRFSDAVRAKAAELGVKMNKSTKLYE